MSISEIQRRDIQWAEGIRGLASLIVVVAHGYEAFGWPEHSFDRPYIFQIPVTRLILDGGYLAVCVFFLLSGYLCSMKPLRLLRAGKPDEARRAIASGALRRVVRLGFPATLATTFSWFLTQIGAFTMSTSQPGYVWLNFHSAWPSSTWSVALRELRFAILHTWTYDGEIWTTGRNNYERVQWTMALSLHGPMMVYLALSVTASFTSFGRRTVILILIAYAVYFGDLLGEIPFYTGTLLADLALSLDSKASSNEFRTPSPSVNRAWPIVLTIFALFLASYPPNSPEMAGWSQFLFQMGTHIFHPAWEYRWAYPFVAAVIIVLSIHFSPILCRILSNRRLVFFGTISYPLYLMHGFMMRSLLSWVVYGLIPQDTSMRYVLNSIAFAAWISLVASLATAWRNNVDNKLVEFAQWAEEVFSGRKH